MPRQRVRDGPGGCRAVYHRLAPTVKKRRGSHVERGEKGAVPEHKLRHRARMTEQALPIGYCCKLKVNCPEPEALRTMIEYVPAAAWKLTVSLAAAESE